jgi:hypothetical protein
MKMLLMMMMLMKMLLVLSDDEGWVPLFRDGMGMLCFV